MIHTCEGLKEVLETMQTVLKYDLLLLLQMHSFLRKVPMRKGRSFNFSERKKNSMILIRVSMACEKEHLYIKDF
jgi:hypothetical protein